MRTLDILRGFALLGVLLMNLHTSFRILYYDFALRFHTHEGVVNEIVDYLLEIFVMGKAMTLFAILFGVGMAIQAERARDMQRSPAGFLARRMAVLLAIGILHYLLLWDGDVLIIYTLCGFLLLCFLRFSARALLRLAFLACLLEFLLFPSVESYDWSYVKSLVQYQMQWFLYGNYIEVAYYRIWLLPTRAFSEWLSSFPVSIGMMFLGMASWKAGVFNRPEVFKGRLKSIAIVGGLGGLCATVISMRHRASLDYEQVDVVLRFIGTLAMALAYGAAGLLYLSRREIGPFLGRMGDLGRMTLTNYLMQSLIFTTIFYGYGFGRLGLVSSSKALLLGLAVFTLQLFFSEYWLKHHRFGPMERLWRRFIYRSRGMRNEGA